VREASSRFRVELQYFGKVIAEKSNKSFDQNAL